MAVALVVLPRTAGGGSQAREEAAPVFMPTEDRWAFSESCLQEAAARGAPRPMLDQIERTLSQGPGQIRSVELLGLSMLQPPQVWALAGGMPSLPITAPRLAATLFRLAGTGLFSAISVSTSTEGAEARALVTLQEQPLIRSIAVRGLVEMSPEEVMSALLSPHRQEQRAAESRPSTWWEQCWQRQKRAARPEPDRPPALQCAIEEPPAELLARLDRGSFKPGLIRSGVEAGLRGLLSWLYDLGYLMATARAELSADGALTIEIDEGRIDSVELRGLDPVVVPKVAELLGLRPGQIFLRSELTYGLQRVRQSFVFLQRQVAVPETPAVPELVEDRTPDGARRFHFRPAEPPSAAQPRGSGAVREARPSAESLTSQKPAAYHAGVWPKSWRRGGRALIQGKRLEITFSPERVAIGDFDLAVFRHTQVTNYGPGLSLTGWVYDPGDRIHLALDLELALGAGPFHWIVGPRVQIPALSIAELGVHVYGFNDTPDRWRISAIDSYLHSLFLNRPQSEYFRRNGFSPFITFHLAEHLTFGAEYRLDDYESLPSRDSVFTFFNSSEPPWPNPAIDAGKMGSVLLRLEWSTQAARPWQVGSWQRHAETSLVDRDWELTDEPQFRTMNTVEVANRALGSDSFSFTKVISDNALYLLSGRGHGLRLRFRVGAGSGVPAQKQEALGGWSALRGYDFKEFRGNASLLGSLEYRYYVLGMFADVGSVHQDTGWITPRLGLGLSLHFGGDIRFSLAWRTDSRASGSPAVDFFLKRSF